MILVSYDIANDKLRTKFAKDLDKFGHRLQYSVWEIKNSDRLLNNVIQLIDNNYANKFSEEDSVYIFKLSKTNMIKTYGFVKHEDDELIIVKR